MPTKELKNIIQKWLDWLAIQKNYSKNTIESYFSDLELFLEHFSKEKAIDITDLDNLEIRDFRNFFSLRAKNGISKTSIAREESAIKNFYKWLNENKIIENTEIFQINPPKLPKVLPRSLDIDSTFNIIDEAKNKQKNPWIGFRDMAIFTLLYGCGLRISEAISINLEDIKTNELIKIRGKGGKDRYVPLLEEVKETINLYIKNCPYRLSPKDALFLGARGERVTPRVIQRRLQEIRNKLNLPDNITPHALRHSFATHLLKEGTDLRSIQELLGHASLSSTQRYTDVDLNKIKLEYNKAFPD